MSNGLGFLAGAKYPFEGGFQRWLHTLLIPGAIVLVASAIMFGISFIIGLISGFSGHTDAQSKLLELPLNLFSVMLQAPIYGYCWHLAEKWKNEGFDAEPLEWSVDQLLPWTLDGLKLALYNVVVGIVLITVLFVLMLGLFLTGALITCATSGFTFDLAGISSLFVKSGAIGFVFSIAGLLIWLVVLFLIQAYIFAPLAHNLEAKSIAGFFNLGETLAWGTRHFSSIMKSLTWWLVLGLVYIPLFLLSCLTCIGWAPLSAAITISITHFLAQAFFADDQ